MIRIYPKLDFTAKCPSDQENLEILDLAISGMHCLAELFCPTCGNGYYANLPAGHDLWGSVILNKLTAEVYDPFKVVGVPQLTEGFLNPVNSEIVPIVHKFLDADRIVIINCLDFLYGHSLLKLLNVQHYLDHCSGLGCCVLVPTQLMHLVPDGVAEIWEFTLPIKEGWKWYPSLQRWINQELTKRKECFLSPAYSHPSHRVYDLHRFVRNLPNISEEIKHYQPIILFSYREDRLWGRTLADQQRNLQKLYNKLSVIFPDMAFVLVGFGQHNKILSTGAKLIDLRTHKFDVERDCLWMSYMSAADCVVGVHGSNMLLPSGLAKSTVELVQNSRLANTVQDFLFTEDYQDIRDALLFYRMLYGNETLSNIQPSIVTDMIKNVLAYAPINSEWFKAGEKLEIPNKIELLLQDKKNKKSVNNLQLARQPSFAKRAIKKVTAQTKQLIVQAAERLLCFMD